MSCIFLLEDDPVLGETVKRGFEIEGYQVLWARDLRSAMELSKQASVDLYLLDWNLPDGTGLSFCEQLRRLNVTSPILFLTARTEEEFAVQALSAGAHDFIRKPCGQQELLARIKRLLGETFMNDEVLRFADLKLYLGSRKMKFREIEMSIHRKEFDVLVHLVRNGDVVTSRDSVLNIIDPDGTISDRAVDAHMSRLRTRFREMGIDSIEIKSIYGQGYRMERSR